MKRVRFSNILVAVGVFAILLIAPYLLNTLIDGVYREYGYQIPLYFNLDTWYDIMSIAFPAALTYIVIRQSERQQKDNMEMQKSLERINEKMLDLEKKSKIGYFVPHVKLKDAGIDGFEHSYYNHDLKKYITLANVGTDDVFVIKASGSINGRIYNVPCEKGLFVPNNSLLKELNFDCSLHEEGLSLPHIDLEINLTLRNMIGYEYVQMLFIGFKNNNGRGTVDSFNMSIQEVSDHAD